MIDINLQLFADTSDKTEKLHLRNGRTYKRSGYAEQRVAYKPDFINNVYFH